MENTAMMHDPTVFMTARAEHKLRIRGLSDPRLATTRSIRVRRRPWQGRGPTVRDVLRTVLLGIIEFPERIRRPDEAKLSGNRRSLRG
jgi:hypothetical protein